MQVTTKGSIKQKSRSVACTAKKWPEESNIHSLTTSKLKFVPVLQSLPMCVADAADESPFGLKCATALLLPGVSLKVTLCDDRDRCTFLLGDSLTARDEIRELFEAPPERPTTIISSSTGRSAMPRKFTSSLTLGSSLFMLSSDGGAGKSLYPIANVRRILTFRRIFRFWHRYTSIAKARMKIAPKPAVRPMNRGFFIPSNEDSMTISQ